MSDPVPSPTTILPWRRRDDLVVRPRRAHRRGGWVLKDPIASRYYTLREEEYFVWSRLSGVAPVELVCREFGEQFAPLQLSVAELQRFVGQLIGQGLLVPQRMGGAAVLEQRRRQQSRLSRWAGFNLLAIRFRGVDPDRWLDALAPWCRRLFSVPGLLLSLLTILSAVVLWATHATEFSQRWPEELAQLTVSDVWSFAAILVVVKVLHELGHALACKRFGGEVHEMGVLLLVFTPCLYCNVSDAWLLPSKWQRMAISAAGMWVEAVLAAVCAWIWWASEPGWLHSASLQTALVCGVSTLLFNINPLLRYDGYFILADAVEVPNLQQQAWTTLTRHLSGWLTGVMRPAPPGLTPAMQRWLPVYAAASIVYRLIMVVAILWFLYRWLEPQGLAGVAHAVQLSTVAAMLLGPALQMRRAWENRSVLAQPQTLLRSALVLGLITLLVLLPLPCRVQAPALLEPRAAQGIYATIDGALVRIVPAGTAVQAGDEIALLENPQLQRELARLEGETALARVLVSSLERRRLHDAEAALQLPAAQKTLDDALEQLRQRRAEAERLVLRAPKAGTVWPVPNRIAVPERHALPLWSGSPFDERNRGCWVTAGTGLAQLGEGRQFEAVAFLAQRDVAPLQPGQTVRVFVDAAPGRVLEGKLVEVAVAQTEDLSTLAAARLKLPLLEGRTGARLVGTWYLARVRLTDGVLPPLSQAGGSVSIVVPPRSLWNRACQWFQETFPSLT